MATTCIIQVVCNLEMKSLQRECSIHVKFRCFFRRQANNKFVGFGFLRGLPPHLHGNLRNKLEEFCPFIPTFNQWLFPQMDLNSNFCMIFGICYIEFKNTSDLGVSHANIKYPQYQNIIHCKHSVYVTGI